MATEVREPGRQMRRVVMRLEGVILKKKKETVRTLRNERLRNAQSGQTNVGKFTAKRRACYGTTVRF